MEGKYGIENLKILFAVPVAIGQVSYEIHASEDRSWKRFLKVVDVADETFDLLKVKWDQVKGEILDLDDLERKELVESIKQKFDIADDNIEGVVEDSLSIIDDMGSIVSKSINLYRRLKNK